MAVVTSRPIDQPLRIVQVAFERSWQGGEEQARLLVRGLRQQGHEVTVLARDGGIVAEQFAREGCQVLGVRSPIGSPLRGPAIAWRLRQLLRRLRPDVVHFHDSRALATAGLAAWNMPGVGRVVSRKAVFPIRSAWRYRHLADRVIAVSEAVAKICRGAGVPAERLRIVSDGVDPGRMAGGDRARGRASLRLAADETLLLSVGSLCEAKGHADLLAAMPEICRRQPRVRWVVAGEGKLRSQLAAQIEALGLAAAVRLLGQRSDVPDLMAAADLLVIPSRSEGLCSSLLDGMFAGVPIVTTTAGGIPELVGDLGPHDAAVARLVPPGDPGALAAAIGAALADPGGASSLVIRARQRAEARFTATAMVAGTLAVYGELRRGSAVLRPAA